jgi:hypothetical protein
MTKRRKTKRRKTLITDICRERVDYGGCAVRRIDVYRHLRACGAPIMGAGSCDERAFQSPMLTAGELACCVLPSDCDACGICPSDKRVGTLSHNRLFGQNYDALKNP